MSAPECEFLILTAPITLKMLLTSYGQLKIQAVLVILGASIIIYTGEYLIYVLAIKLSLDALKIDILKNTLLGEA